MKKLLIYIFILLHLSTVAATISVAEDYIVGEGDLLDIKVYDNDDLNISARIGGEGNITMPLLGSIKIAGMTVTAAGRHIEKLLADGYLVSPQVSVFIREYRSKKVTILGQVEKPGLYELQGPTSLLELISKAGGLAKDAGGAATIKRKSTETDRAKDIAVDMRRLVEQGDTSLNLPVQDGDSIYIAKAGIFYVTGEVKKPGSFKYDEEPTIIKAITLAGGLSDKAAPDDVKIIRKVNGRETVYEHVKMDEAVQPDDVIVVPESFF